jgi:hypothetical protein
MKHIFSLSLLLLTILLPATTSAHDFEVDGIYYNINGNGNEIIVTCKGEYGTQYSNEYSGNVIIPATVTYNGITYSVTSIGDDAFEHCGGLASVTIPNSVTSIGGDAFRECCGLTSIDIPNSVTYIGWYAFYGCGGLTSITIPNSVTFIGAETFSGTPWYNNQPDGLVYAGLVAYKFKGTMPSGTSITIIDGTLSIAGSAFYDCSGLTSVTIPNSVTSIGSWAFYNCSGLSSVTIPKSVTSIGDYALSGCSSLTIIKVANGNTKYDSRNSCNAIIETASNKLIAGCKNTVIPNSVTTIDWHAFSYCSGLTSIDIPNSVTSIGGGAFSYCSDLVSITIPNSVTLIGNSAFSDCSSLASIDIPNSIITIGSWAFYNCIGLTSIDIPNSVTSIEEGAFMYCSGLTSLDIGNSVTSIDDYAFYDCNGLTDIFCWAMTPPTVNYWTFSSCYGATLFVPEEAVNAYKAADYWKNFTNMVAMPYTFEIDGTSYRAMTKNTANVIANIDEATLYSGDVIIPESVTYAGRVFAVTGIENNAFDGCFELTSVVIPNSVTDIGEQAFQGCTGLTNVIIGSGVTAIGAKAFNYCNALATVKCLGTVPPVMASTDCFTATTYNRAALLVPRNYEATYAAADYWYKFAHIDGWGSAGMGDVDGDGVMSIKDVTVLIDALLGTIPDSFYFESADMNHNGRLDISDVTSLIDNLLFGF